MHAVIGVLALATFAISIPTSFAWTQPGYAAVESFDGGGKSGRRLVVIHAAWCGHCKTLLASGGVWSQVKRSLPGVAVGEIDEADAPDLVRALSINGFPDIRILDGKRSVAAFRGERTADAIVEFALKHVN